MDIEKAKAILDKFGEELAFREHEHEKNAVMRGLQILAKYENDVWPQFGHDVIWASSFEETVPFMSEEDVIQMAKLGWFYDDDSECWSHV